jgi:acetyl-CoA synthetase
MTGAENLERGVREIRDRWEPPGASAVELMCDRHPEQAVALVLCDERGAGRDVTFGELRRRSEQIAGVLHERGVGEGDRVATLMGKGLELVATIIGAWRVGAIYAPLFTAFAADGVRMRLEATQTTLVVCDEQQAGKLAASDGAWSVLVAGSAGGGRSLDAACATATPFTGAHAGGGDGPIVHMLTSGTTGTPKGVVHPLRYLAGWEGYFTYALAADPRGRFWSVADPGWAYGLYTAVLTPLALGLASHLQQVPFSPHATAALLREREITDFAAAPTIFRAMRAAGVDVAGLALERASTAGEPLTPDVTEWARGALGVEVRDHFGQTELGMVAGQPHHEALLEPVRPSSMGRALPGWAVTILRRDEDVPADDGELGRLAVDLEASPFMTFGGYVPARGDRFTADGRYYLTGDAGVRDADGSLSFGARDDDVIIMAGYRIGPADVESVLAAHPAVAECAVVAVPDEVRGEVIKAVVVATAGAGPGPELEAELRAWVKDRYAAHAAPRIIAFTDRLPRTPSGKVQRYLLRDLRG